MKKIHYLLLSSLLLASCELPFGLGNITLPWENGSVSDSMSASESLSTSASVSISNSESESVYVTNYQFIAPSELYLDVNETYNVAKMLSSGINLSNVSIFIQGDTASYKDGIIKGEEYGDCNLIIKRSGFVQNVSIHVVEYFEYGSYFTSMDVGRFYDKNILMFGDSITHNWNVLNHDLSYVHPQDPDGDYGYSGWVGYFNNQAQPATITNVARSGGTMVIPKTTKYLDGDIRENRKCFPTVVEDNLDAVANADYIFIFYGANDYLIQASLGAITDKIPDDVQTPSSFCASFKYGIEKILSVNENAKIFVLSTLMCNYAPVAEKTTYKQTEMNNLTKMLCEAYMVRYVDMYSLFTSNEFSTYSDDGLHPNDDGNQIIAKYILNNGKK